MTDWLNQRYCVRMAKLVFFTADTITIRLLLAWASLFYAVLLMWPVLSGNQHWFARPAYALMAYVAPEWVWATIFFVHFVGVHWRALDPEECVPCGLAVNILGVVIWAYSTATLNVSLGSLTPGTMLEWTLVVFSLWALYRTGLHRELVTE